MKLEFYGTVKNGKISKRTSMDIKEYIESLEGKRVMITVDRVKKSRSAQQNAYLHLMLNILKEGINDLGNTFSMIQIKEMMKYKFLKIEEVNEDTGEIIGERIKGTAELTTVEMSEFVNNVIEYAREEFNLTIPLPDTQLTID